MSKVEILILKIFLGIAGLRHFRNYEIWCFPKFPDLFNFSLQKICRFLNVALKPGRTNNTTIAILWEDATKLEPIDLPRDLKVINGQCLDISKQKVQAVFESVFGYPLAVDPATHIGEMVCKSDKNAVHDGYVLDGPIPSPEPGKVYELLIDNRINDSFILDLRVPIIGATIPFIYLKERWVNRRFENENSRASISSVGGLFSEREVILMLRFADAMGADFCELDVLRDKTSNKIYIVDLAKTAFGPPVQLPFMEKVRAISMMAESFERRLLKSSQGSVTANRQGSQPAAPPM